MRLHQKLEKPRQTILFDLVYKIMASISQNLKDELECIKGTWSVRELRRQIDTKLFVRAFWRRKPGCRIRK